jgi:glycerophosphoryl diester phosphodiesterase
VLTTGATVVTAGVEHDERADADVGRAPNDAGEPQPQRRRRRLFGGGLVVIGHRGLGRGVVEGRLQNTPESVDAAVQLGLPWVEIDVRRTVDDVLVVAHDPVTASGREIAACRAGEVRDEGLATLDEVLAVVPRDVGVVLDVKSVIDDAFRPLGSTTAGLVAPVARGQGERRPLMAYSFDASALLVLHRQAPEVARGMLTWRDFPISAAIPSAVHLGAQTLAVHTGSLVRSGTEGVSDTELATGVDAAHVAGLEVVVWCPPPQHALRLAADGVDAVCVDDVPRSLELLSEAGVPLRLTHRAA